MSKQKQRMDQRTLVRIDFDAFDTVYGVFTLPKGTLVFRGHSGKSPVIDEWPMYFTSNPAVAKQYADAATRGMVSQIRTSRKLKVLDLRYAILVITDIVNRRKCVRPEIEDDFQRTLEKVLLAYGGCSLDTQIRLMRKVFEIPPGVDLTKLAVDTAADSAKIPYKQMGIHHAACSGPDRPCWVNPVEPQGVRLGESGLDMEAVLFLREIFSDVADGYIAPALNSPFQLSGTINSEIVVFNPKGAGLQPVADGDAPLLQLHIRDIVCRYKVPLKYHFANDTVGAWVASEPHLPVRGGGRRRHRRLDPSEMIHNRRTRKAVVEADRVAKAASDGLKASSNDAHVASKIAARVRPTTWTVVGGSGLVGGHP